MSTSPAHDLLNKQRRHWRWIENACTAFFVSFVVGVATGQHSHRYRVIIICIAAGLLISAIIVTAGSLRNDALVTDGAPARDWTPPYLDAEGKRKPGPSLLRARRIPWVPTIASVAAVVAVTLVDVALGGYLAFAAPAICLAAIPMFAVSQPSYDSRNAVRMARRLDPAKIPAVVLLDVRSSEPLTAGALLREDIADEYGSDTVREAVRLVRAKHDAGTVADVIAAVLTAG